MWDPFLFALLFGNPKDLGDAIDPPNTEEFLNFPCQLFLLDPSFACVDNPRC